MKFEKFNCTKMKEFCVAMKAMNDSRPKWSVWCHPYINMWFAGSIDGAIRQFQTEQEAIKYAETRNEK